MTGFRIICCSGGGAAGSAAVRALRISAGSPPECNTCQQPTTTPSGVSTTRSKMALMGQVACVVRRMDSNSTATSAAEAGFGSEWDDA
mmetsp:Transcript_30135/g.55075  ORF Transcript_30135/g.55075 Transcript_30135/m.55075 type:complete len:88 (-) Transcript_30135:1093-1356(-)|eukprot:CAMPEP_0175077988 /NCGR_PEP_ID=MMETSP0052_2-20121109/23794_1 /TAXON_ID=51329 ORGANISM="Polytomella parva, Strain SAG 63-3" /NCGR_SAMPLE_ID=MMETSP0052_2 /ASSEMBLY_ACC=CAM_ASM_000194 /LENGTH=87 /DNA_ID=CAMNT_0016347711 /DNA_START=360 /DNA_END=623 /DNA_ORIENTATION=-